MLISNLFYGLNPDVDKRNNLYNYIQSDKEDYYENTNTINSLRNRFFLNQEIEKNETLILKTINEISLLENNWNNYNTQKIDPKIINNTINIINSLSPSILNYLRPENIYPSKTGTIIIDWEIDCKNILSLEIAKKSIGYFLEVNGVDFKQVHQIEISDLQKIVSSIDNDVSILI